MEMIRDANVLTLDLRDKDSVPESFEALVAKQKATSTGDGVVRPWNLLLIDTVDLIRGHHDLYESILQSSARPRLIILLEGDLFDAKTSLPRVTFPPIFQEHRSQVRILAITNRSGCEWAAGAPLPSGIGHWAADPSGELTLPILIEPLAIEEVFNSLFAGTSSGGYDAWSIGTKQVWFGRLPAKATADSLYETGQALVGDDGDAALLPKSNDWEIPPALDGTAVEENILTVSQGSILEHYQNIRRLISAEKLMFGVTGSSGALRRVAAYADHHERVLKNLEERTEAIEGVVTDLLNSIDAGDGFNEDESRRFDQLGIVLKRQDNYRSIYRDAANQLNDRIVNGVRDWIRTGHSIAPLIITVEDTVDKVRPLTREQILEKFQEVSLQRLKEKLATASLNRPKGNLIRIAVATARLLQPTWARVVFAVLYSWLVATGIFEAFDHGRTKAFLPVPQAIREQTANVLVVLAIIVTLILIGIGIIFTEADNRIRRWGKNVGLIELERAIQAQQTFLERVTLNEWVLSKTRRRTANSLKYLSDTLRGLAAVIREKLIDSHEALTKSVQESTSPNPSVRRDLNDVAAAGTFMQLERVIEILRTDISTLIDEVLSLRIHEFKGIGGAAVPREINESIALKVDRFVERLIDDGPLSLDIALSRDSVLLRKTLIETYWKNVSLVSSAVHNSALTPADAPLLQFVNSSDLLHLDQQPDETVLVRFAPEPSRDEIYSLAANDDMKIIFTETTSCAGVLRLTGFRNSFAERPEKVELN
ncbi:MAG: hypothetical protein EBX92_04495 [Actinobacteria bacterium]|nr:hypothetical protein [Actinomycetota bacterium]